MSELQERAARDNLSLKDEVNNCIERALRGEKKDRLVWKVETYPMGGEHVDFRKAWELVGALEAEAVIAKKDLRK